MRMQAASCAAVTPRDATSSAGHLLDPNLDAQQAFALDGYSSIGLGLDKSPSPYTYKT